MLHLKIFIYACDVISLHRENSSFNVSYFRHPISLTVLIHCSYKLSVCRGQIYVVIRQVRLEATIRDNSMRGMPLSRKQIPLGGPQK